MLATSRIGLFVGLHSVHAFDLAGARTLGQWPALPDALAALVAPGGSVKPRATVELVVSDAHCRYLVLPRPDGVRSRSELDATVTARFNAVFGDAQAWTLRRHSSAWAERDFVVGLRHELLDELQRSCAAAGLSLRSVRPHWLALAARLSRSTRRGGHWIISNDGQWGAAGYVQQGQCLHLRSLRTDARPPPQELVAREQAFLGDGQPDAQVWSGAAGPLDTAAPLPAPSLGALWGIEEPSL